MHLCNVNKKMIRFLFILITFVIFESSNIFTYFLNISIPKNCVNFLSRMICISVIYIVNDRLITRVFHSVPFSVLSETGTL